MDSIKDINQIKTSIRQIVGAGYDAFVTGREKPIGSDAFEWFGIIEDKDSGEAVGVFVVEPDGTPHVSWD